MRRMMMQARNIVLRDDVPVRKNEGLLDGVSVYLGDVPEITEVKEHNCIYFSMHQHNS